MKKILTILILVVLSISIQLVTVLPWWSFLVVVFFLGVILPLQKWRVLSFLWAFIAGFFSWSMFTLVYDLKYQSEILDPIVQIADLSTLTLYILVGSIGGVLYGLAFYSGYLLRKGKEELKFEISEN